MPRVQPRRPRLLLACFLIIALNSMVFFRDVLPLRKTSERILFAHPYFLLLPLEDYYSTCGHHVSVA